MKKLIYTAFGFLVGLGFIASYAGALSVSQYIQGGTGTTTAPLGQLLYGGTSAYQSVGTTSASCSGNASCGSFTVIGNTPITITATGGGSGSVSTSSIEVANQVAVFSSNGATPALIAGDTGLTFNGTADRLTFTYGSTTVLTTTNLFALGTSTLATTTVSVINGNIVVDGAHYPQTGAGIQSALNTQNALGGGTVFLPCATYSVSAKITIPSGTTLEGSGSCSLIQANSAFNKTTNVLENSDTSGGNDHITIRNLKIDGNQVGRGGNSGAYNGGNNINFVLCDSCTVEKVEALNATGQNIALLNGTAHTVVRNSLAYAAQRHNILLESNGTATTKLNTIENNIASSSVNNVGIELASTTDNVVIGNQSFSNGEGGIHMYRYANNNTITGNSTYSNSQNGISLVDAVSNNTIANNIVDSNARGGIVMTTDVLTFGGNSETITGNIITNNGWNGIRGSFASSTIDGNQIISNGASGASDQQYGVYIATSGDFRFCDNYLKGNTARGLDTADVINATICNNTALGHTNDYFFDSATVGLQKSVITGNKSSGAGSNGFTFFKDADHNTITGNSADGAATDGFNFRGATDNVVSGNIARSNTTDGFKYQEDASNVCSSDNAEEGNIATGSGTNFNRTCGSNIAFTPVVDLAGSRMFKLQATSTDNIFTIGNYTSDFITVPNGGGIIVSATSTIGAGGQTTGLTINGGATTSLNAYFASKVLIATTTTSDNLNVSQTIGLDNLSSTLNARAGNQATTVNFECPEVTNSTCVWRLFRTTNTSATAALDIMQGTNANVINSRLSGGSNGTSYLNSLGGNVGVGTSSPYARLSVQTNGNSGNTPTTLFAIGSSTQSATSTLFSVNNVGLASTSGLVISNAGTGATKCLQVAADGTVSAFSAACSTGTGTVTSITNGGGLDFSVSPITTSGTITAQLATGTVPTAGRLAAFMGPIGTPTNVYDVATSAPSFSGGLTTSGTAGAWVGGSSYAVTLANVNANSVLGCVGSSACTPTSVATSSLFTGSAGQNAFFSGTGLLIGTSSLVIDVTQKVGVGTSTPFGLLSINPTSVLGSAPSFIVGSSSATVFQITNTGAASTSALIVSNVRSALHLASVDGTVSAFGGSNCGANTYTTSISALGALTCGQVSLTAGVSGDLPFSSLAQVSANSVLGNNTSITADAASISTSTLYTWGNGFVPTGTLQSVVYQNFTYATTSWTGTTSIPLAVGWGQVLSSVRCDTKGTQSGGGGTVNVQIGYGTASTTMFSASTTIGVMSMASTSVADGARLVVDIGTPASSPRIVVCTLRSMY